ncbi:MAG: ATP-binding protein, partial [Spirochaetales bacterium]|nr:ATP-binding protein [Spirochaetales bacterium]
YGRAAALQPDNVEPRFGQAGAICIYMTVREDRMIIEVSDTGIGIPEQELNDIFHPFEQQDKQDARHFEGTGLGLSIVYKLVKLMGGSIHVTSDLWKGSCFTLNLPAVYAKETSRKTFAYKKEPVLDTELICLTEESYLNDRLKTAGKEYNIHFLPLSGTKTKKGTETNKTVLVLAHHPIRDTLVNGCIHIPLIPADRLQNNNKKPEYYFIREDLEADKTAAILFSIFQREHKSDSSPLLPYNSLSETGRQALLKAVNSCNFNDIEELLPHLGSCGEKGKKLAEQLKKGTADFDIPMVKKILEQIGNEISGGT